MSIKVNYNATTGAIVGFYPDSITYQSIPEPNIEIDEIMYLDCINNQGERIVDTSEKVIKNGTMTLSKDQQYTYLDIEYQPQFTALSQALVMATLAENTDLITSIKADYADLKAEYDTKRGEIIGS